MEAGVLPNFSGEYMIRMFYTDPTYFKNWEFNDVTLATQCSCNHLHHVVMLTERWSGPISVAVFAPNQDAAFATDAILSMQECWPEIKTRVTFHLVYPTEHKGGMKLFIFIILFILSYFIPFMMSMFQLKIFSFFPKSRLNMT